VARAEENGGPFEIHASALLVEAFRRIQRRATLEGRGLEVLEAIRYIRQRLSRDPSNFGEPLYRLPALRMQIHCGVVGPLAIHYGVCEDRPLVFIRGIQLL
jgi:hypothetical protein